MGKKEIVLTHSQNVYNSFQLGYKYLQYYLSAANGRGHGVHSPFVFDFITKVLRDHTPRPAYAAIEQIRSELLQHSAMIEVADFGAGSGKLGSGPRRKINAIARTSLKPPKYAQLLYRIAAHYQPQTILELGTSFGISTAYMASAQPAARVITCEGAPAVAAMARQHFKQLQLNNIALLEGDFADSLPAALAAMPKIDLAFIDGNHRQAPTLAYFEQLLPHARDTSVFIFDDIHWSAEMEAAWTVIREHPAVTLSIDLFFIGMVIFSPDINHKQQFRIRF